MKFLSSFTHLHVDPNLIFFPSIEHKISYLQGFAAFYFLRNYNEWDWVQPQKQTKEGHKKRYNSSEAII